MNRIKAVALWFFIMNSLLQATPMLRPSAMKVSPSHSLTTHTSKVPFMGKIILPATIQEEVCIFHKDS